MTKLIADSVYDQALSDISTATDLHICSGDPADRAAVLANSLANLGSAPGTTGPANGDVSGRKITVDQNADMTIDQTGDADHVCLIDATELLLKTSVSTQSLTTGGTVTQNAFDFEIADPT